MKSELDLKLAKLEHGGHLCVPYEDRAEQMAIESAFLKVDLDRREQVVYAAADTADTIAVLPAAGVDVARERERGALQFLTMCNSHLRGWRCDADTMIES